MKIEKYALLLFFWYLVAFIILVLAALACAFQPLPVSQTPHVAPKDGSPQALATYPPCVATVHTGTDGGALNFRAGPGTEFPVNTVLAEGERVTVIMPLTGWAKVRISRSIDGVELELTGYVRSIYLEDCK